MENQGIRPHIVNFLNLTIGSNISNEVNVSKSLESSKEATNDVKEKFAYSFRFHQVLLVCFLMILWLIVTAHFVIENYNQIGIGWMALSMVAFIVFTYFFSFIIYTLCENHKLKSSLPKKKPNKLYRILLSIASPSWYFADYFKNKFKIGENDTMSKKDRIGFTRLIAYLNGGNVIVAGIIAIIAVAVVLENIIVLGPWFHIFTTFVVLRTLSRSFEITYAFGKDASDGKIKVSLLKSHERLMLAFTSLIECILNYSTVYYLISFYNGMKFDKWYSFVSSFQSGLFYSNSFLKGSPRLSYPSAISMLQLTQVVTCMTLVFVAFAIYISNAASDD